MQRLLLIALSCSVLVDVPKLIETAAMLKFVGDGVAFSFVLMS